MPRIKKLVSFRNNKIYSKKGGNPFEIVYYDFIQFCINYNNDDNRMTLFGETSFVHIKGGSSIKYHLTKYGMDVSGITADIDILLIPNGETEEDALLNFFNALQKAFPQYHFQLEHNNGLYNIFVNGLSIFDITIYHQNMNAKNDPDTSMFIYALHKLGIQTTDDYVNLLLTSENVEFRTFTSVHFEYFSTEKGIENTLKYLRSIEEWSRMRNNLKYQGSNNKETKNLIARLNYQTSAEYVHKLEDKYNRYLHKLELLEQILSQPV